MKALLYQLNSVEEIDVDLDFKDEQIKDVEVLKPGYGLSVEKVASVRLPENFREMDAYFVCFDFEEFHLFLAFGPLGKLKFWRDISTIFRDILTLKISEAVEENYVERRKGQPSIYHEDWRLEAIPQHLSDISESLSVLAQNS